MKMVNLLLPNQILPIILEAASSLGVQMVEKNRQSSRQISNEVPTHSYRISAFEENKNTPGTSTADTRRSFHDALPTPPPSTPRSLRYRPLTKHLEAAGEFTIDNLRIPRSESPTPAPRPAKRLRVMLKRRSPVPPEVWRKHLRPNKQQSTFTLSSHSFEHRRHLRSLPKKLTYRPKLLFRGFSSKSQGRNSETGFVAGAFRSARRIPRCLNDTNPIFLAEATRHVGLDRSWPTPFVSLTTK